MGFDIVHLNLHKTFATPHGGGGPGRRAGGRLRRGWPTSCPARVRCAWRRRTGDRRPGLRLGARRPAPSAGSTRWHGNALVLARALAYISVHGGDGLRRVAERAVLNANWLRPRLDGVFDVPFDRPCMHEVVLSAATLRKQHRGEGPRRGQAAARGGLPLADRLLPAHRRRGAHDRADRDREPPDPRGPGRRPGADRRRRGRARRRRPTRPPRPTTTPVRRVDEARAARHLVPTFDARPRPA